MNLGFFCWQKHAWDLSQFIISYFLNKALLGLPNELGSSTGVKDAQFLQEDCATFIISVKPSHTTHFNEALVVIIEQLSHWISCVSDGLLEYFLILIGSLGLFRMFLCEVERCKRIKECITVTVFLTNVEQFRAAGLLKIEIHRNKVESMVNNNYWSFHWRPILYNKQW